MTSSQSIFENIKQFDDDGVEYWSARDLYKVLEYTEFNKFVPVIKKAITALKNSDINPSDHIAQVSEMIETGKGAKRKVTNYLLTRLACYLIVQNGDPRKEVIALGQSYFAIQTRRQEIQDEYEQLTEDQRRLSIRGELTHHNKSLADAAHMAGIINPIDYAIFQNKGYQGLYGGLGAKEIHEKKGLKKSQQILDHMGSTELAANLFRATQTDEKIRRENIKGKDKANQTHYEVGKKVRETIKELGGTMPEDLPSPKESIKQIERKEQKKLKLKK